jgi:RNA polymerase sigma-70 factor (ECF subfamily)
VFPIDLPHESGKDRERVLRNNPKGTGSMKSVVAVAPQTVERAKAGDIAAFELLYQAYKHPVFKLCLKKTGDVHDAEDLTQEVFVRVYRKVNGFRGDAAFSSWLYRVTLNIIMMHFRKRRTQDLSKRKFGASFTAGLSHDDDVPRHARYHPVDHIALERAISGLGQGSRRAVVLHDIEGMSYREIARDFGVPTNTSKSQVWRAHREMRQALNPSGIHPMPSVADGACTTQMAVQ